MTTTEGNVGYYNILTSVSNDLEFWRRRIEKYFERANEEQCESGKNWIGEVGGRKKKSLSLRELQRKLLFSTETQYFRERIWVCRELNKA